MPAGGVCLAAGAPPTEQTCRETTRKWMVDRNASDLFITVGFPPAIKVDGKITPISHQKLEPGHSVAFARAVMNDKQKAVFEASCAT